jgi:hypothetical protein
MQMRPIEFLKGSLTCEDWWNSFTSLAEEQQKNTNYKES